MEPQETTPDFLLPAAKNNDLYRHFYNYKSRIDYIDEKRKELLEKIAEYKRVGTLADAYVNVKGVEVKTARMYVLRGIKDEIAGLRADITERERVLAKDFDLNTCSVTVEELK